MQRRYKILIHQLHDVEQRIITLRGELKWEPSAPAEMFRKYDGAVFDRAKLEDELYMLEIKMEQQKYLDQISGEPNKVVPFPTLAWIEARAV